MSDTWGALWRCAARKEMELLEEVNGSGEQVKHANHVAQTVTAGPSQQVPPGLCLPSFLPPFFFSPAHDSFLQLILPDNLIEERLTTF